LRDRQLFDCLQLYRARAEAVLEIVSLLRYLVGYGHRLTFEMARLIEKKALAVGNRKRVVHLPSGVFEDSLSDLIRKIQTWGIVSAFEEVDDSQRLVVVFEPADLADHRIGKLHLRVVASKDLIENRFAGVTERSVAEIVAQRSRLREVLVEAEGTRNRARELADLEGVGESSARMISDVGHEDLGLVLETAKGASVEDAVAITLKFEAKVGRILLRRSPSGGFR
jgi:hypothetical protein